MPHVCKKTNVVLLWPNVIVNATVEVNVEVQPPRPIQAPGMTPPAAFIEHPMALLTLGGTLIRATSMLVQSMGRLPNKVNARKKATSAV